MMIYESVVHIDCSIEDFGSKNVHDLRITCDWRNFSQTDVQIAYHEKTPVFSKVGTSLDCDK